MTQQPPRNIDEARLLANITTRAQRLFQDGYTLTRQDEHDLIITNDEGDKRYYLSTLFESCTCKCMAIHGTCKHYLGWRKLEETQAEYEAHLLKGYDESEDYGRAVMEESLLRRTCGANI